MPGSNYKARGIHSLWKDGLPPSVPATAFVLLSWTSAGKRLCLLKNKSPVSLVVQMHAGCVPMEKQPTLHVWISGCGGVRVVIQPSWEEMCVGALVCIMRIKKNSNKPTNCTGFL